MIRNGTVIDAGGGPIVTTPGGYPDAAYGTHINDEVPSSQQARDGVRDLAIAAGVDVVEHLAMPRWPSPEEENRLMTSLDPVGFFFELWAPDYQPRLERMAAQGTAMVPTVSALLHGFYVAENPTPHEAWVVDVVLDIVRRFHEAGGVVGVANDFSDRGSTERLPLLELEMLQEAGLTAMDVIVAATRNNARVCGQEEDLGTLEPGKLADIIVVDGDPLSDLVGSIRRVTHVVLGGELVVGSHPVSAVAGSGDPTGSGP